ncbi:uncharacterized protein HMPREF1541_09366 [Cyphellophora europaea CBS 101466]|uniref:NAD(P)-binding protein n=1 Tax=Cyphellophora europaea (strain CBS 101466) TaxID=1220924 RepID=W2SC88_CYPE1|nr:uncharacterized protein HMPREF1541_09366 [Cyphellophora europaea CBS 101466]ETN45534.1 hypothetical protein HMPREF1541_09366 [Cyphellophora europaea CBS 101466]
MPDTCPKPTAQTSPPERRLSQSSHLTTDPKLTLPATTDPPSSTNPPSPKVWLVFGATGHMGRSIVKAALQHNDLVCAVGRTSETSITAMQDWYPAANDRFLGLLCDVRIRETVAAVLDKTMARFGRIEVIANCTGYGVIGACEDQDEFEIRNQFETNFMGTLNIIQLSLPYFRERQEGRYLIFSSTSGALGVPGLGPYCATKYAVEGLIESMLYEVDQYNIKPTLVEPGHLRRDDVHSASSPVESGSGGGRTNAKLKPPAGQTTQTQTQTHGDADLPLYGHFKVLRPSAPYSSADAPAKHAQRLVQWYGNNQPTSVVKAAELVWQLGHSSYPPLRMLLGTYAVESVRDRLKSVTEEIEDWKHLHYPAIEGMEEGDGENPDKDGEGDAEDDDDDGDGDGYEGDEVGEVDVRREKGQLVDHAKAVKGEDVDMKDD